MTDASRTLNVRTTVTLPDFQAGGIDSPQDLYVSRADVVRWLEKTADVFDRAHAVADIGNAIRACATTIEDSSAQ